MDTLGAFLIAAAVLSFFVWRYWAGLKKAAAQAQDSAEKGKLRSDGPMSQHPQIDISNCIGCAACTSVCPEGDVLAMVGGKAAIVNGYKCIGHSLCADACPVGAITMVMAKPGMGAEMPYLTPKFETTVPNLFIAGELGGLALIKNAIAQGRDCVDTIASRLAATPASIAQTASASDMPSGNRFSSALISAAGPARKWKTFSETRTEYSRSPPAKALITHAL
jgi:Pyruvate/2-oxoacid:ferredoxin oxidoreductase delta subunit